MSDSVPPLGHTVFRLQTSCQTRLHPHGPGSEHTDCRHQEAFPTWPFMSRTKDSGELTGQSDAAMGGGRRRLPEAPHVTSQQLALSYGAMRLCPPRCPRPNLQYL